MNDTHGYLEPHPEIVWTADRPSIATMGGFARIAAIFAEARSHGEVLAFDSGDTFHGTPALVSSRGDAIVPILNALGLSAMTGHWDFAYGPSRLKELTQTLNFPFLAANCEAQDPAAPRFPGSAISGNDVKVGVIGLAATILDKTMPASFSEGLRFSDGIEETRREGARLREAGCDLVMVLSHLGFPQDCALAEAVDGIDVILSGHTHNRLTAPMTRNGALIIQSGCHGSFVGRLDLTVEGGRIADARHWLIPVDADVSEEPRVKALVASAVEPTRHLREQIVGHTDRLLHRVTCLDSPMDDVLLAAIARAADTEIAFSNGWRYGAPIPAGPITVHDLLCMVPMNPPIQTVDLTGGEIRGMMEDNLEATFSGDPFGQRGGYVKRFRGLIFNVKIENPHGARIETGFTANGQPVVDDRVYRAAYITEQGVAPRYGSHRKTLPVRTVDALSDWFALPESDVRHLGRLRIC
ncbi:bifunctional metallophosphatase/5'-nucleotidase [Pseudaminobacter arsenicus]|uniref:Bifunctional metallophosphatase/5'-nucleotidase n=1 Tax=Borborobacter arsenicus TaxID=1851146 RepID=A0A432V3P7_9HYPH|nr:bifunctional metallophosphatase/5'-nucleotidase [Pseudaminobacter arsenicus]